MLVDKYKPLRGGDVRSADEKLRSKPPEVRMGMGHHHHQQVHQQLGKCSVENTPVVQTSWSARSSAPTANEPILPGIEGHKPWLTTFKPPSHAVSVKLGNIPLDRPPSASTSEQDPIAAAKAARDRNRSAKRRSEQVVRLTKAKEETLDYRLGIKGGEEAERRARANPVGMRGWASLVEERIEVCIYRSHRHD
jgi:hypothetical protein